MKRGIAQYFCDQRSGSDGSSSSSLDKKRKQITEAVELVENNAEEIIHASTLVEMKPIENETMEDEGEIIFMGEISNELIEHSSEMEDEDVLGPEE